MASKPFTRLTGLFTACSILQSYAMSMMMTLKSALAALVMAPVALSPMVPVDASARGPKDEQDAARRAMLEGRVMPFAVIKRRIEREMADATYVGSEFNQQSNRYRLKYVRNGRVVWVDVDGRTGDITGWAH